MKASQFQRVSELFLKAQDMARESRHSFLDAECGDDDKLRDKVLALLEHDEESADENRVDGMRDGLGRLAADLAESAPSPPVPERLGRYRILEELGRGGMGVVYRAEQDEPRRTVALKIIRPALVNERLRRRFEYEAAVLGHLHHPGIAQIIEAHIGHGSAGDTLPFFAMELVEGEPLTTYCRRHALDVNARVRLLIEVCDAVHHAHQKGIVHRDLKPANILVTPDGRPKVLDFGVARAMDPELGLATLGTTVEQVLGTLAYMSPEQVQGGVDEVDTRSDVYSLGVVAYEVLGGALPHDVSNLPIARAARVIAEEPAPRLGRHDRSLQGDLETAVSRAMEKEHDRRYPSAHAFGRDLRRYLDHEPLEARPPTTFEHLHKFARRHRGLMAGLVATTTAVILGFAGMTWLWIRASAAEERAVASADTAQRQAKVTRATGDFLDRMLTAPDPWNNRPGGPQVSVVDVLERADQDLERDLAELYDGLPEVEASLRDTLGNTYRRLGLYRRAEPHLQRAHDLRRELLGAESPETLHSLLALAAVRGDLGEFVAAERLTGECLALHRRVLGDDAPETLDAMTVHLTALQRLARADEALELANEVWEISRDVFGEEHHESAKALHNVGFLTLDLGDTEAALPLLEDAYDIYVEVSGEHHPESLSACNTLARALLQLRRHDEADSLLEHSLEIHRQHLGEEHPATLVVLGHRIDLLFRSYRFEEADQLAQQQNRVAERVLGPEHPITLSFLAHRVNLLSQRDPAAAEPLARRVLEAQRRTFPPGHEKVLLTLDGLANILLALGREDEALATLEEAHAIARESLPEGHWVAGHVAADLGHCLTGMGRFEEAEQVLLAAQQSLVRVAGPAHHEVVYLRDKLRALNRAWGRPETSKRADDESP